MFYYFLTIKLVIDVPCMHIQYSTNHNMIYNIPILRQCSQKGLISEENLKRKKIEGFYLHYFCLSHYMQTDELRDAMLNVKKEKLNQPS